MSGARVNLCCLLCLAGLVDWCLFATRARAADTMEPFQVGASNAEFYLGYHGLGTSRVEHGFGGDLVFGYGVSERLSAFFGAALSGNGFLDDGSAQMALGVYGSPLQSEYLDLDLLLGLEAAGEGFADFALVPGLELTLKGDPEMKTGGGYYRAFLELGAQPPGGANESPARDIGISLINQLGIFYCPSEGHQLLLEVHGRMARRSSSAGYGYALAGLAVGYNFVLSDSLELINEIFFDVPHSGKPFSVGLSLGFIATLPTGRQGA